jgi:release factor glutamine methyltransferase
MGFLSKINMLPTPSTSHISFFSTIYEPAEDSFLLLDTLSNETESAWLKDRFPRQTSSPLVTEIGTGSGVVIAFLAANAKAILGRDDVLALGVDVNADACTATKVTVQNALAEQKSPTLYLGSLCSDLGNSFNRNSVDILIFNPPYVPSDVLPALPQMAGPGRSRFDTESHLLSLSYAGGKKGMETTDRLLDDLPRILSARGVAYVMFCARNEPEEVKTRIEQEWGGRWSVETVGRSGKTAGWEKLEILRIWRSNGA